MSRRRIPARLIVVALLAALIIALALQPISAVAGAVALGLTVVVATVLWLILPPLG